MNSTKTIFAAIVLMTNVGLMPYASADELRPFTSDGCSVFPDGTYAHRDLWLDCCHAHDFAYWKGGTYDQRLEADKALRMCVNEVGEPEIAILMLAGIRVGGSPIWPTSYRWGYGWSYPKWYSELTDDELKQIQTREEEFDANSE